jgi:hypothetical protein
MQTWNLLRFSGSGLVLASWLSAALFGLYILFFYLGALSGSDLSSWNNNLPGMYEKGSVTAVWSMAAHLLAGAILLLLGPLQLIDAVRLRWLNFHRWTGRVYVLTAAMAGLGGLLFIAIKGTIGGPVMNVGFGLYGLLMVVAAVETYRHARALRIDVHRAWGIRLFALAIGSWLYRMDYGFWLLSTHRLWHTSDFRGPFDIVMAFFFYVPNLILAELFIRSRENGATASARTATALVLNVATLFVLVGTYYFTRYYWGPGILARVAGTSN